MRAPRVFLILAATLSLPAAGQDQISKAPTVVQGINAADADPKPCKMGGSTGLDSVRDATNSPGTAITTNKSQQLGYGPPQAVGIRAVPVNPPTVIFPPDKPEPMTPRDAYFETFFDMIGLFNLYAEQADKAGKHKEAASFRTNYQREIGLNDTEGEIMQEIVHDCHCAMKEVEAKMKAEAEKFQAQLAPGATVTVSTDFYDLFEQRKMALRDHVDQLRVALGDSSFKKLETFVLSMYPAPKDEAAPKQPSTTASGKSQPERQ